MPLSKEDRVLVASYRAAHHRCAVCHDDGQHNWNPLEVHHISRRKGPGSSDHRALLLLCRECHQGHHGGGGKNLTLGNILQAKADADGSVDLDFLATLKNRKALAEEPEELPLWATEARIDNQ